MKEIADRIRKVRLERGMTQQELADALGLKSRSSINKIEMDTYDPGPLSSGGPYAGADRAQEEDKKISPRRTT